MSSSITNRLDALERKKGTGKFSGISREEHADALATVKEELRAEFAEALGTFRAEVNEVLADLDEAEDAGEPDGVEEE